jgi:pimeloyl-ACP methyl ester carboxylesterase
MMVIAHDNRGIGKSSRPDDPYTLDTLVEDIKDLLNYLDIQEQIHLCGFSNGSAIAQAFTLKYPSLVKTLILLGAASYLPAIEYEQQLKALEEFKSFTPEQIIRLTIPIMFSLSFRTKLKRDNELFELYKNDMGLIAHLNNPPRYQDYVNQWKIIKDFDTRELLPKIKQPTLIVVGSKDQGNMIASKIMCEKIPNSIVEVLENIGHGIIIEAPEKTNNIMWNFLKDHLDVNMTN